MNSMSTNTTSNTTTMFTLRRIISTIVVLLALAGTGYMIWYFVFRNDKFTGPTTNVSEDDSYDKKSGGDESGGGWKDGYTVAIVIPAVILLFLFIMYWKATISEYAEDYAKLKTKVRKEKYDGLFNYMRKNWGKTHGDADLGEGESAWSK